MRAAIYARYSSDRQSERSIADQLALCRDRAAAEGWAVAGEYADRAVSGAHALTRPELQRLLADAASGALDVVLAEALDRLSRSQRDTAEIFERLAFAGVGIVTLAEGEVSELHVGLKGTMNALFLKDLADKVRRGQRGRAAAGKAAGGLAYGYRVVRRLDDRGEPVRGEREVDPAEAEVVRRIFHAYAAGRSTRAIVAELNAEGVPAPRGAAWTVSMVTGNRARRTGVLWNEAYRGRLVWNRVRMVKDPSTGRRVSRVNPESAWQVTDAPALRIVSDDLWERAHAQRRRYAAPRGQSPRRRPRSLLSGLVRCGLCGASMVVEYQGRLGCTGRTQRGTCAGAHKPRLALIEGRVLEGIKARALAPEVVAAYVEERRAEAKRLRRARAARAGRERKELGEADRRIRAIISAIEEGQATPGLTARLAELEARREELAAGLEREAPEIVELHPNLAGDFRRRIERLEDAVRGEDAAEAREILRALIDRVEVAPGGARGQYRVTLHARAAAVAGLAGSPKASGPTLLSVVAGDGYRRDRGPLLPIAC